MLKISNTAAGVASLIVTDVPCRITRIKGYYFGAADKALMVIDAMAGPNVVGGPYDGLAAVWQQPLQAAFLFDMEVDIRLTVGAVLVINHAANDATYTAGNTYKANFEVEYEPAAGWDLTNGLGGLTGVGDSELNVAIPNATDSLTVYTDVAGNAAKRLYRIVAKNTLAAAGDATVADANGNAYDSNDRWLMITADAANTTLIAAFRIPAAQTRVLTFSGLLTQRNTYSTVGGVMKAGQLHYGCYIAYSTDGTMAGIGGGLDQYCMAWYK